MNEQPRVWIGCLGCYNDGALIGDWFDADDAPESVDTWCKAAGLVTPFAHCADGHEELWCFDHEGFGALLTGECSPGEARRLAELIESIAGDGYPVGAVVAWAANRGDDLAASGWDLLRDDFADAWQGEFESDRDFAQQLAGDLGESAECANRWPYTCIDWGAAADELFYGDYWADCAPGGRIYVYRAA